MASFKKNTTKEGRVFYEIRVSAGHDQPRYTTRFYPADTWSERTIQRELQKAAAAFENACRAGEIKTRAETKREKEAAEAAERAAYTFARYASEIWLPWKSQGAAENTKAQYRSTLERWLFPAFGNKKLRDITSTEIEAFLFGIVSSGLSYRTMQLCRTTTHMVFEKARRAGLVSVNPVNDAESPKKSKEEAHQEPASFTAAELVHIFECLEVEPLKWRLYIHLLADTGCRRAEACALQWSDITGDRITIRHGLTTNASTGEIMVTTPKSGKQRTVDVGPETMELLKQQRQAQLDAGILSPFVFTQEGSAEPMYPSSPTRYFRTFGQRYGIKDFHPHKLRHTHASLALTSGADIVSTSERLGHASPAITMNIYAHASQDSIRRVGDLFREALEREQKQA